MPADPDIGRGGLSKCFRDASTLSDAEYRTFMRRENVCLTSWVVARTMTRLGKASLSEIERRELWAMLTPTEDCR